MIKLESFSGLDSVVHKPLVSSSVHLLIEDSTSGEGSTRCHWRLFSTRAAVVRT